MCHKSSLRRSPPYDHDPYPPERKAQMRHAARAEYEAKYTADRNYQLLMESQ